MTVREQAVLAKSAAASLAAASTQEKNRALAQIAQALDENRAAILKANERDIAQAKEQGMAKAMLDRLTLTDQRISGMISGVEDVIALEDPVGEFLDMGTRTEGLVIGRKRVPLGVVAIIYESRPNVTVDAAVLCLKAGNTVILRGGKEAIHTNRALEAVMKAALKKSPLPEDAVHLVQDISRESATALMGLRGLVDVLIPRGGGNLIRSVVEHAKVPVIETGEGNCHVYIDGEADLEMGAKIIQNAKCSRPSVCNAAETLLVDKTIAAQFLPRAKALLDPCHVELRGDEETCRILGDSVIPATEADYETEFLDYVLAIRVVDGIEEAMAHIARYSTSHSECIVTESYTNANRFLDQVDAAAVYVNASTRFTDGGVFGLGAEIGISTQKMHARGPMGLHALTSTKFVIYGAGQVR